MRVKHSCSAAYWKGWKVQEDWVGFPSIFKCRLALHGRLHTASWLDPSVSSKLVSVGLILEKGWLSTRVASHALDGFFICPAGNWEFAPNRCLTALQISLKLPPDNWGFPSLQLTIWEFACTQLAPVLHLQIANNKAGGSHFFSLHSQPASDQACLLQYVDLSFLVES